MESHDELNQVPPEGLSKEDEEKFYFDLMRTYMKRRAGETSKELEENFNSETVRLMEQTEHALKDSYGLNLSLNDRILLREVTMEMLEHEITDSKQIVKGIFDPLNHFSALNDLRSEIALLFINRRYGLTPDQLPHDQDALFKLFADMQDKEIII